MLIVSSGYNDPKYSDVIIRIGDSQFHVLKFMLSRSSEYFHTLFFAKFKVSTALKHIAYGATLQKSNIWLAKESTGKEVELHDDDEHAVEVMLKFIYGLGYAMTRTETFTAHAQIYAAAEKYGVGGLKECVTNAMRDKLDFWYRNDLRREQASSESWGTPADFNDAGWSDTHGAVNETNDSLVEDPASAIQQPSAAELEKKAMKDDFYEAIKIVYTFTTEKDQLARPLLAGHCAKRATAEEDQLAVRALVRDFPELGLDLFNCAYSKAHTEVMLWVCNRCGKAQENPHAVVGQGWEAVPTPKCKGCHEVVFDVSGMERGRLRPFVERGF